MPFSDDTVEAAWERSGEQCECRNTSHFHGVRCGKELDWGDRGRDDEDSWEAHHIDDPDDDSLSNCHILCWECHKATF